MSTTFSSAPTNVVIVFSGENLETIKKQGGTGDWVLKTNKFITVEYVLIIRNLKKDLADKSDGYEHGQAFILGKFQAIKPKEASDRKIIQISEFVELPKESFKNVWVELTSGQRNPITYKNATEVQEKIHLNLNNPEFKWQKIEQIETEETNLSLADIINEARNKIAKAANVDKSKVNIQISF